MISRRLFIENIIKTLGISAFSAGLIDRLIVNSLTYAQNNDLSLKNRAAAKGLFYGAASFKRVLSYPDFSKTFIEECGILVPEWELKWRALRPTPTSYDFNAFDWLINFTSKNNMKFRGHTLVWHDDLPAWFSNTVNSSNAKKYLQDHILTVMKRHAGKIHSWDVVNEPIAMWDKHPDGLRASSPWYKLLGPEYIEIAFRTASEADPNAMLVLNQNHLEQDKDDGTRSSVLKLLKRLKFTGTPIHALGIESHLGGKDYSFNKSKFKAFLSNVADIGLKIIITELDVMDQYMPKDISLRDKMVANIYEEYLSTALSESAVIGVLTWGLSDRYTWLSKFAPREDKAQVRPLPLDQNLQRKLAWYSIANAFDNTRAR